MEITKSAAESGQRSIGVVVFNSLASDGTFADQVGRVTVSARARELGATSVADAEAELE